MGTPDNDQTPNNNESTEESAKVDWEKRFKDTQKAFTKSQQELGAEKAKNKVLSGMVAPTAELDEAEKERLDLLKVENPEAWREEMNNIESAAKTKHNEALSAAERQALQDAETQARASMLAEFNESSEVKITPEVIQFDLPPRFAQKLENGEYTYLEFLEKSAEWLKSPKVVGDANDTLGQPNLGEAGGGDHASDYAIEGDIHESYKDEVY